MLRYHDLTTKKSRFLALTGLTVAEFAVLLAAFQEAFEWYMSNRTMTGQKREYRRYRGCVNKIFHVDVLANLCNIKRIELR
jgi:hypothetical protein